MQKSLSSMNALFPHDPRCTDIINNTSNAARVQYTYTEPSTLLSQVMISFSVTIQRKIQKCLEFIFIFIFLLPNHWKCWFYLRTETQFNHLTLIQMLENHISRSTWFVVATTNNEWLKKMNFANFRSKIKKKKLGAGCAGITGFRHCCKRGKQSIFPNLRTFHP